MKNTAQDLGASGTMSSDIPIQVAVPNTFLETYPKIIRTRIKKVSKVLSIISKLFLTVLVQFVARVWRGRYLYTSVLVLHWFRILYGRYSNASEVWHMWAYVRSPMCHALSSSQLPWKLKVVQTTHHSLKGPSRRAGHTEAWAGRGGRG